MYYYQHNIDDFNAATIRLSRLERWVYRDAIELYYAQEKGLTSNLNELFRDLDCRTPDDQEALEYVLSKYFRLEGDLYINNRCEEDLEKYHNYQLAQSEKGKKSALSRKAKSFLNEFLSSSGSTIAKPLYAKTLTAVQQWLESGSTEEQLTKELNNLLTKELNLKSKPKKDTHAALAENLGVDLGLIKRIVKHRTAMKNPANTDKKIQLIVNNFQQCVDQGLFKTLDQAMDRLDSEPWLTVKPEYIKNVNRENAKPVQKSFSEKDYGQVRGSI